MSFDSNYLNSFPPSVPSAFPDPLFDFQDSPSFDYGRTSPPVYGPLADLQNSSSLTLKFYHQTISNIAISVLDLLLYPDLSNAVLNGHDGGLQPYLQYLSVNYIDVTSLIDSPPFTPVFMPITYLGNFDLFRLKFLQPPISDFLLRDLYLSEYQVDYSSSSIKSLVFYNDEVRDLDSKYSRFSKENCMFHFLRISVQAGQILLSVRGTDSSLELENSSPVEHYPFCIWNQNDLSPRDALNMLMIGIHFNQSPWIIRNVDGKSWSQEDLKLIQHRKDLIACLSCGNFKMQYLSASIYLVNEPEIATKESMLINAILEYEGRLRHSNLISPFVLNNLKFRNDDDSKTDQRKRKFNEFTNTPQKMEHYLELEKQYSMYEHLEKLNINSLEKIYKYIQLHYGTETEQRKTDKS